MIKKYPAELLADFQEYYNIDLFDLIYANNNVNEDFNYYKAGILCSQLPMGSRVMREFDKNAAWNDTTKILAHAEYDIRCFLHAFLSLFSKNYKAPENGLKLIEPLNRKELENRVKGNKKMEIDGQHIEAVTKEELAKAFPHHNLDM